MPTQIHLNKYSQTMIKVLILSFSIVLGTLASMAQNSSAYKITVKNNGWKDTICFMGYYYGKFQYSKDTAQFDSKGVAVFENKTAALDRGVYFIVFPDRKHFDFVINTEQIITFEVDTTDFVSSMKVTGSKENQWFYDYNKAMNTYGKQIELLRQAEKKYTDLGHDSLAIVKQQLLDINTQMMNVKEQFVTDHPQSLVTKIFQLSKDPELPEPPLKPNGEPDSAYLYHYFKDNYWKYTDFSDDALIRTPVFHSRLERFMTSVLIQHPDSIIKELKVFVPLTEVNQEVFKYVIWFMTFHYESSQIMGHDAVFVYLADTYYKTGKAFWASETVVQKITSRADKLRPILIGSIAPNMALIDTTLNTYSQIYTIKSTYTIMIFWDPDCGHCKKEIDVLKKFWDEQHKELDFSVYAICADTSLTNWKKLIHEKGIESWINVNGTRSALGNYQDLYDVFATPLIFILDENKKIIAKKLSAEATANFLPQYDVNIKKENNSQ